MKTKEREFQVVELMNCKFGKRKNSWNIQNICSLGMKGFKSRILTQDKVFLFSFLSGGVWCRIESIV